MAPDLRPRSAARLAPLALALLLSLGAGEATAAKKKPAAPAAPTACSDFYMNVNQPWLSAHPLPSGLSSYSRWNELNIAAQQQLGGLLTGKGPAPVGPASRLLADLVASSSDAAAMDAGVRATAAPLLKQIDAARKPRDLARVIAALHAAGVPVLYGFDALRDEATGRPVATFYPSGLGLPGAGYYLDGTPELKAGVDAYRAYLAEQLRFAGVPEAKATEQAAQVFALEQSLARAMAASGREQQAPAALGKAYPNLQLAELMQSVGWAPAAVAINQPLYFHAVDKLLAKPNVAQWQAYLRAQVLHSLAPARGTDPRLGYLSALKVTSGQVLQPIDRLGLLALADGGDLVSAAYAESFPAGGTVRATAIAEALRAAMGRAIDRAGWLDAAAKADARARLSALRLAVGQPPESVSVADLSFERGNLADNLVALRRWNLGRSLARLNSAVWPAPVQQWQPVIGYQPTQNRVVVSAAALQAPVIGGSDASDYGSFGALVGQQLSLAFAEFLERDPSWGTRQAALATQYSSYAAGPTARVNGAGTAKQNAADLAGLELAWDALNAQGKPDANAAKEFFRGWATVWARQDDSLALAAAQAAATQAPARWRVNGPLANLPAFGQAFACKPGQPMARATKDAVAAWR